MLYDTSNIWYGDEGVRGYSLRLLDFLERESQEERGSWSEFAAPTARCEIMPRLHLGTVRQGLDFAALLLEPEYWAETVISRRAEKARR